MRPSINAAFQLICRGAERIIDTSELETRLLNAQSTARPLIVKLGVDPTAPDIHLGHTVPLRKLRHFQDLGHKVCFLIGDFTSRIGDPSGRDKTRPPLTEEDILFNARTYLSQVGKILDRDKLTVVYNSHWLDKLSMGDMIRMTAQVTMSKLLEHNTFKQRMQDSGSIRVHELLYPFMQGYDSVALKADVEIGGSDQTFNLTFGRELQKYFGQEPQVCITMPILEGTDGTRKMSKSLGNYIGIDDPPAIMFDKIMRMHDRNIVNYFTLLTDLDMELVRDIRVRLDKQPDTTFIRHTKIQLAREIIRLYHSAEAADIAAANYGRINKEGLPPVSLHQSGVSTLVEWMVTSMGMASKTSARKLISQGGVRINGIKISADMDISTIDINDIIKLGKFKSYKVVE